MLPKIPIEVSARHIHLCQKDLEFLFGKGYCLTKQKNLTQSDCFAARETVTVRFKGNKIANVRVVSPLRPKTQLEISLTDAYNLGVLPVIRKSGDLKGTPGILLVGSKGELNLKQGLIIAWRHLHVSPKKAKELGIKDKDLVSVKVKGKRAVTFHNVAVRVGVAYKLGMHLDTDEGNAAGITKKAFGQLI